ncbi:MAG: hypothetical protein JW946_00040 [Candidatus Omnitrophica bacterium]|nr:hypothetical protein [Candidatus Omnitrophota bacterium]
MKKIIGKITEIAEDIRTGIDAYVLARKYSRRNRGITTKSLVDIYGKD